MRLEQDEKDDSDQNFSPVENDQDKKLLIGEIEVGNVNDNSQDDDSSSSNDLNGKLALSYSNYLIFLAEKLE